MQKKTSKPSSPQNQTSLPLAVDRGTEQKTELPKKAKHQNKTPSLLPKLRFLLGAAVLLGIMFATVQHVAFSPCVWLRLGPLTLMCPVGFLEISLGGRFLPMQLLPGFVVVCLLIFFLGRAWCGWLCPASLAGNVASSATMFCLPHSLCKKIQNLLNKRRTALQKKFCLSLYDGLALLAGLLLGVAFFSYPVWSILCPLGVVSRNLISLSSSYTLRLDLLFLLLPFLSLFVCQTAWKCTCPVGVVQSCLSTNMALLRIQLRNEEDCTQCRLCKKACPTGQYPGGKQVDAKLCTRCGLCMEVCPKKCLRLM